MQISILNEKATTKNLVTVKNHGAIGLEIGMYLEEDRFNYIVTAENIADVKKSNAELNRSAKLIKDTAKLIIENETKSVTEFKANTKMYLDEIEAKRTQRLKDIEVFESETKGKLRELLLDYVDTKRGDMRDEFHNVSIEDLIKLSNLTVKGALTKSAKDGVKAKIQVCLNKQNRYDLRVANLKVVCFENGLTVPLDATHIQGIVFEDIEEKYQDELLALIVAELDRVKKIEERIQKDADIKAQREAKSNSDKLLKVQLEEKYLFLIPDASSEDLENIQRELINYDASVLININTAISNRTNALYFEAQQVVNETPQQEVKPFVDTRPPEHRGSDTEPPMEAVEDGKKVVTVVARFEVLVPDTFPDEKVVIALGKKLESAGITSDSLKSLEVV